MDQIKFSAPIIRLSMAQPINPKNRADLQNAGYGVDPEGNTKLPSYVRQGDLEAKGLKDFASDLTLYKIVKLDPNDVRDINGGSSFPSGTFIILNITPSKQYKNKMKAMEGLMDENKVFPGAIKTLNVTDGTIVNFGPIRFSEANKAETDVKKTDLASIFNQIQTQAKAKSRSDQSWKEINAAVREYNVRLDLSDDASANLTVIPAQLYKVKRDISKRIESLNRIIEHFDSKLTEKKPAGVEEFQKDTDQLLLSDELSEKDYKDTLLNKYYNNWEQLVQDLKSTPSPIRIPNTISNPEEFKQKMLSLAELIIQRQKEDIENKNRPREEQQLDISSFDENEQLKELSEEDIPFSEEAKGYKSFHSETQSYGQTKRGSELDRSQLQSISDGIGEVINMLNGLPKGSRGIEALKTPDGQKIVDEFINLCENKFKVFLNRYRNGIVENGKIDLRKVGTSGSTGNGLIIISFVRIWAITAKMLNKIGVQMQKPEESIVQQSGEPSSLSTSTPAPSSTLAPTSKSKMIIKIAKSQWDGLKK